MYGKQEHFQWCSFLSVKFSHPSLILLCHIRNHMTSDKMFNPKKKIENIKWIPSLKTRTLTQEHSLEWSYIRLCFYPYRVAENHAGMLFDAFAYWFLCISVAPKKPFHSFEKVLSMKSICFLQWLHNHSDFIMGVSSPEHCILHTIVNLSQTSISQGNENIIMP